MLACFSNRIKGLKHVLFIIKSVLKTERTIAVGVAKETVPQSSPGHSMFGVVYSIRFWRLSILLISSLFTSVTIAKKDTEISNTGRSNVLNPVNSVDTVKRATTESSRVSEFLPKLEDINLPHCFGEDLECSKLAADCLKCNYNYTCVYGERVNVTCEANPSFGCSGPKSFTVEHTCSFCYQLRKENYYCHINTTCRGNNRYVTQCTTRRKVHCLGNRIFSKNLRCNYVSGKHWSTALFLSITLGGFGVDRFYLGDWQEGIGKLFSFGGLGIWTLVDVILIATGYLKPADGSRYI
ncbi:TM2 domain-containing protein 3 [Halotydeus destructor]|nr:TM2 domain-containing protein 3 [Halotydeus destructor]